jgi:hypothetical protein
MFIATIENIDLTQETIENVQAYLKHPSKGLCGKLNRPSLIGCFLAVSTF